MRQIVVFKDSDDIWILERLLLSSSLMSVKPSSSCVALAIGLQAPRCLDGNQQNQSRCSSFLVCVYTLTVKRQTAGVSQRFTADATISRGTGMCFQFGAGTHMHLSALRDCLNVTARMTETLRNISASTVFFRNDHTSEHLVYGSRILKWSWGVLLASACRETTHAIRWP